MSNTIKVNAEGESGFVHLTGPDVYKGTATNHYSITLTLDKTNAKLFKDAGAKMSEYQGKQQVKMTRKVDFDDGVFGSWDADGSEMSPSEFSNFGDLVRVRAQVNATQDKGDRAIYFTDVKLMERNPEASEFSGGDF